MNNWKSSLVAVAITTLSLLPTTQIQAATEAVSGIAQSSEANQSSLININTADESELANLPGVGAKKASEIVKYRTQVGEFTSVEELLEIKGIGPKILEKLKSKVTL